MKTKAMAKRGLELLGLMMVGEGMVGLCRPIGYLRFWESGRPDWMRRAMDALAEHPTAMRGVCACEVALGLWLATQQLERA